MVYTQVLALLDMFSRIIPFLLRLCDTSKTFQQKVDLKPEKLQDSQQVSLEPMPSPPTLVHPGLKERQRKYIHSTY